MKNRKKRKVKAFNGTEQRSWRIKLGRGTRDSQKSKEVEEFESAEWIWYEKDAGKVCSVP